MVETDGETRHRVSAPVPRFAGWVVLAAALAGGVVLAAPPEDDIRSLLPPAALDAGWRMPEAPRVFRGDDLFELIDGGADLYLEYGFEQVAAARYEGPPPATLQIELYRMRTPAAAYGVYSMMQSGQGAPCDVGQAGQLFDDYLVFWKGPYYISLTAAGPRAAVREMMVWAGRCIAERIKETGAMPALLDRLPRAGLRLQKYFRGGLGLANLQAFGGTDPFKAGEGVCGFYPSLRLFILRYANEEEAAARMAGAGRALAQADGYHLAAQTPDGFDCVDDALHKISVRRQGDCLVLQVPTDTGLSRGPVRPAP
jgi:hypothetical protein